LSEEGIKTMERTLAGLLGVGMILPPVSVLFLGKLGHGAMIGVVVVFVVLFVVTVSYGGSPTPQEMFILMIG
jgi:hypothetical protein